MGIFGQKEYKTVELPFCYVKEKEDDEAGAISIEANGIIEGVNTFFYASFMLTDYDMYENGDYNEIISELEKVQNAKVNIKLKYRRNKLINFAIDVMSLSKSLGDQRFENMEFIFLSFGEKSRLVRGENSYEQKKQK